MGFRFRKSISILPGLKLNISKKGISTTIGKRGASLNIGRNGIRGTVGIPGTGLSYSEQLFKPSKTSRKQTYQENFSIVLRDDCSYYFINDRNEIVDPEMAVKIRRDYKEQIRSFLLDKCDEFNQIQNEIENINAYFNCKENDFRSRMPYHPYDIPTIETMLEQILGQIHSPLKFSGSFEVECKEGIWLDIDLPEIEEIPDTYYIVTQHNQLSRKQKTQKKIREEYSRLVAGIAIIIANVIFVNFPTVEQIVISGYTQRVNRATGNVEDQYIYSLHIMKHVFERLNLQQIDPVMALTNFNPVWDVTKTLEWRTISPYYRI